MWPDGDLDDSVQVGAAELLAIQPYARAVESWHHELQRTKAIATGLQQRPHFFSPSSVEPRAAFFEIALERDNSLLVLAETSSRSPYIIEDRVMWSYRVSGFEGAQGGDEVSFLSGG